MNVGIRPRLRARPSLYDLVRNRNIDRLSIRPATPSRKTSDLPPLPTSPKLSESSVPPTPIEEKQLEALEKAVKMAPNKSAVDANGDEQFGTSTNEPAQKTVPS